MKEWIIDYLSNYNNIKNEVELPKDQFIRALMNITQTDNLTQEYYDKQDTYLKNTNSNKGIVNASLFEQQINVYQGDITTLEVDVIVNAGNEKLLGCFVPLHNCVDNAIHSAAGLQVRRDLTYIMKQQGTDEVNGFIKITKGYNLPSKYIFHTVGPKVYEKISNANRNDLKNSYLNSLIEAEKLGLKSIAFPCISTGIYGYPNKEAAVLAFNTVKEWLQESKSTIKVIFNVFKDIDKEIYTKLVGETHDLHRKNR